MVRKMKKTIEAWKKAEVDLGIEIENSFILDGNEFPLLVKYFGTELGTVIVDMDDFDVVEDQIPKTYYCSGLNPEAYNKYDRNEFIDTLEDWGWFGPKEKRPPWYTDKYRRK